MILTATGADAGSLEVGATQPVNAAAAASNQAGRIGPPRQASQALPRPAGGVTSWRMTEVSDPLVEQARMAALAAYAPYSRFSVGCAIESVDGEIALGANMENACYRLGVCA